MTDSDIPADAPTHAKQNDDYQICAFTLSGRTVFFDVDDSERWIQSSTTVALADAA